MSAWRGTLGGVNAQRQAVATVPGMAAHTPPKIPKGYVPTSSPLEPTAAQATRLSSAGLPLGALRILWDCGIRTLGDLVALTGPELRAMCADAGDVWQGMRVLYVLAGRHRLALADGFYCDESIPAEYSTD